MPYDDTGYVAFRNRPKAALPGFSFASHESAGTYFVNGSIPDGSPAGAAGNLTITFTAAATGAAAPAKGTELVIAPPATSTSAASEATTERFTPTTSLRFGTNHELTQTSSATIPLALTAFSRV